MRRVNIIQWVDYRNVGRRFGCSAHGEVALLPEPTKGPVSQHRSPPWYIAPRTDVADALPAPRYVGDQHSVRSCGAGCGPSPHPLQRTGRSSTGPLKTRSGALLSCRCLSLRSIKDVESVLTRYARTATLHVAYHRTSRCPSFKTLAAARSFRMGGKIGSGRASPKRFRCKDADRRHSGLTFGYLPVLLLLKRNHL